MDNDNENEARSHRKTKQTIDRLLNAAAWSIEKFEEVKEEMTGPLAILEAGNRCITMAQKLQEFERNEAGTGGFEGRVILEWAPGETYEGESDEEEGV